MAQRLAPVPADPAAFYRARIAELEAALADATAPNLREDARNRIKRLDVHPPEEEGGPPRIILEGNLPQMLRLAGVDTMKKGHPYGAAFLDRVIDSSIKRDPGARPLVGCGATPRA